MKAIMIVKMTGICWWRVAVTMAAVLLSVVVGPSHEATAKDKDKTKKHHAGPTLDKTLRTALAEQGVTVPDSGLPDTPNADLILLGQALFFDGELSGNRDIACATCHFPTLGTGDGLSLPIGTGAVIPGSLGHSREKGFDREFIPRNAPEVFNRGSNLWFSQFWDSRVSEDGFGGFNNPAGSLLPLGLPNVLAVQAMFPVTSRDEMRGAPNDNNEIAAIPDGTENLPLIWNALVARLLAIQDYRTLLSNAYGIDDEDLEVEIGFEHAATAIAAFEAEAFTFLDSPFDKYLAGNNHALSTVEKRGAVLFYGRANCSTCHAGPLMTDQQHYNLLVPHLGPGKVPFSDPPVDPGRALVTEVEDLFRFRTPPLRNVAASGPYMHNGAYTDLTQAVRHHLDTVKAFEEYDPAEHLDQTELIDTVVYQDVELSIPGDLPPTKLTKNELKDVIKFLNALTAPRLKQRLRATIPSSVPSGLPVDGF